MTFVDFLKAIVFGVVEGITEWLPVSSTGHMILLQKIMPLNVSEAFWEMFLVVVQLGAVVACLLLFWKRLWPLSRNEEGEMRVSTKRLVLIGKIIVSCIPAAVIGVLWGDLFDSLFYNYISVAIALIVVGGLFIFIENRNRDLTPIMRTTYEITWQAALIIGGFQVIAAIFPGVSRSGATILGAILIGVSRKAAAEYTFYLAIPVMFGASLLKIVKLGLHFSFGEFMTLIVAMIVAFLVSIFAIRFLIGYVRKHDFRVFGYYRIALGVIVLLVSLIF